MADVSASGNLICHNSFCAEPAQSLPASLSDKLSPPGDLSLVAGHDQHSDPRETGVTVCVLG